MKNKNWANAVAEGLPIRVTQARAAVYCISKQIFHINASRPKAQRQTSQSNQKCSALKERNNAAAAATAPSFKKRVVLKDVTNVCCDSVDVNCITATKFEKKNQRKARKGFRLPKGALEVEKGEIELVVIRRTMNGSPSQLTSGTTSRKYDITDIQVENHRFEAASQLQSSFNEEKGSFNGRLTTSSNPNMKDIDSDEEDPQSCGLYSPEIYHNLHVVELNRQSCSSLMEQHFTQRTRGILVDWLVEVSERYKLVPDTIYLTVHLIDRFLSQNVIERQKLLLLGITCMLIASKYEEISHPGVEEFCFVTHNTYSREELLKMEIHVLNYFSFNVFAPTAKTFLRIFLSAAQASYKKPSLELVYLGNYLAELTLMDYGFVKCLPSIIAASAVFLARWTLDQSGHPWNATLEHYTTYKASDLQATVLALQDLQFNRSGCPQDAIYSKYRQSMFRSVACLSSQKLPETIFQRSKS